MEASSMIETQSKGAEIYHGEACKERLGKLLEEYSVPKGVFQINQIEELGVNRSTGFFWLKQKKKTEHYFPSMKSTLVYNQVITSFIEPYHMKNITGLQGKKLFMTGAVSDVRVGLPSRDQIRFTSSLGLTNEPPLSAFEQGDSSKSSKRK